MSLSGALSNAMSGLNANAKSTTVISSNIANALNETYGRREITLIANSKQSSGGVKVENITRFSDPILAHQKRLASADVGQNEILAEFSRTLESLWGSIDTVSSVSQKLTKFEASLMSSASDPSSQMRLKTLSIDAEALVASFRNTSAGIQQARTQVDHEISAMVGRLNSTLQNIQSLNDQIVFADHQGQNALAQMDQRDAELDELAKLIPIHVVERESGAIAIFSKQGKTLLDGKAAEVSFQRKSLVEAHMTLGNGLLSGLFVDGKPVETNPTGAVAGGALSAAFYVRDTVLVDAQSRLDGTARDLIERFGAFGPDATVTPGNPGIFSDNGSTLSPTTEVGVSGRLRLAASLSPETGELWRWRDGLYAPSQGESGTSDLLEALRKQLSTELVPNSTALDTVPSSFLNHVQQLSDQIVSERVQATDRLDFSRAQFAELRERSAADGVDTDQELQKLIELEKSYAANARVVRVVDEMLDELLKI